MENMKTCAKMEINVKRGAQQYYFSQGGFENNQNTATATYAQSLEIEVGHTFLSLSLTCRWSHEAHARATRCASADEEVKRADDQKQTRNQQQASQPEGENAMYPTG